MNKLANKSINRIALYAKGFSLIELMIVIVVVGILAKIAWPSYNASIQQSRRTDAKAALLDLATRQEKFFSVNNQYSSDAVALYGTGSSFPMDIQSGSSVYYQLTAPVVVAATASAVATYSSQASPVTGTSQETDQCGTYTINSSGVTGNSGNTVTNCW